jgi:hypothetical protein
MVAAEKKREEKAKEERIKFIRFRNKNGSLITDLLEGRFLSFSSIGKSLKLSGSLG